MVVPHDGRRPRPGRCHNDRVAPCAVSVVVATYNRPIDSRGCSTAWPRSTSTAASRWSWSTTLRPTRHQRSSSSGGHRSRSRFGRQVATETADRPSPATPDGEWRTPRWWPSPTTTACRRRAGSPHWSVGLGEADIAQGMTVIDPEHVRDIGPFGHTVEVLERDGLLRDVQHRVPASGARTRRRVRREVRLLRGGHRPGVAGAGGRRHDRLRSRGRRRHEVRRRTSAPTSVNSDAEGHRARHQAPPPAPSPLPAGVFFSPAHPWALAWTAAASALPLSPARPSRGSAWPWRPRAIPALPCGSCTDRQGGGTGRSCSPWRSRRISSRWRSSPGHRCVIGRCSSEPPAGACGCGGTLLACAHSGGVPVELRIDASTLRRPRASTVAWALPLVVYYIVRQSGDGLLERVIAFGPRGRVSSSSCGAIPSGHCSRSSPPSPSRSSSSATSTSRRPGIDRSAAQQLA